MNKEQLLKKIKEQDEELINTIREQCMYELDLARHNITNRELIQIIKDDKENLDYEKERLRKSKSDWEELVKLKNE